MFRSSVQLHGTGGCAFPRSFAVSHIYNTYIYLWHGGGAVDGVPPPPLTEELNWIFYYKVVLESNNTVTCANKCPCVFHSVEESLAGCISRQYITNKYECSLCTNCEKIWTINNPLYISKYISTSSITIWARKYQNYSWFLLTINHCRYCHH